MELKLGQTVYYLDRNSYNVNNPEELVVAMKVIEKSGVLHTYAKQGYYTIGFEVNEETIKKLTSPKRPYLFSTREAALECYSKEEQQGVNNIMSMSKEDLLQRLFSSWDNEGTAVGNIKHRQAMIDKIKEEFGVEL